MSTIPVGRPRRRHLVAAITVSVLVGGGSLWASPAASAAPSGPVPADLSVTASHAPGTPRTGDPVTFTVTATNAGPGAAASVVAGLSISYPFRYTPPPGPSASKCNVATETGAVLCTLGAIPAGGSATVQVVVTPFSAGVFPVAVAVASDTPDPDSADRSVTDTVIVQQGPTQIDRAVDGIYHLVLGRAPTARETAYWASAWINGLYDRRYRVPLAIISGPESRRRRIAEAYPRLLGRPASSREVAAWSGRLAAGLTYERFEVALVGSSEFAARHPGLSATIQAAFGAILGRPARAAELADWSARVRGGTRISQVAAALSSSTEGRNRVVEHRFRDALGRPPNNFDRFFWFSALNQGSTADVEWAKLLVSDGYLSQFPPVYGGPIPVY